MAFLKELNKALYFFVPVGIDALLKKQKEKRRAKRAAKAIAGVSKEVEKFGIEVQKGEECVILVNGPSLNNTLNDEKSLNFIKSRKKFCVNASFTNKKILELKPEYVVFMDHAYWAKDLSEEIQAEVLPVVDALLKVDWDTTIFISKDAQDWNFFMDIPKRNKNVKMVYVNTSMSEMSQSEQRFLEYKSNISMPRVQNVLVACLYIGINAGFENIYLFGVDHSWHENIIVKDDNLLYMKNIHFYDKEEITEYNLVYKNAKNTQPFSVAELLEAFAYMHRSYEELELYSKYMGTKIYNSSAYSCVDAFERFKIGQIDTKQSVELT